MKILILLVKILIKLNTGQLIINLLISSIFQYIFNQKYIRLPILVYDQTCYNKNVDRLLRPFASYKETFSKLHPIVIVSVTQRSNLII